MKVKKEKIKPEILKPDLYQKYKWLILCIIPILAFLLYFNTISFDYALDDMIVTTDNPLVLKGFDGIKDIVGHGYFYGNTGRNDESYRPLSMVMIAVETEFFGLNSKVNHFFNVFYYSFLCLFLFLMLKQIFRKKHFLFPFLITIIFLAHPIHTEVVANVKSRDEIMQLFFMVLSLLFLMKIAVKENFEKKDIIYISLSSFFYFFALLSKEIAITFLAVFPLILYFFTDLKIKKIALFTAPFFLVFVIYFLIRIAILDSITFSGEIDIYQNALVAAENFNQFIATNLVIHSKYLKLLLFPHPLSWDYSVNQIPIVNLTNPKAIFALLLFIGLAVLIVLGFKKKSIFSFAGLYYLITISIVSNFVVKIASTMGERFIFTSSLGFAIILVAFSVFLFKKLVKSFEFTNPFFIAVFAIIFIAYTYKTVDRNYDWENNETIYKSGIITSPNSARTHISLGDYYRLALSDITDPLEFNIYVQNAISEYEKGKEIFPENADLYYTMGYLYYKIQDKEKALSIFYEGLNYDSTNVDLLNYIGIIYTEKGILDSGETYFNKTLYIDPEFVHALNNIAYIYTKKKEYQKAKDTYKKVIEISGITDEIQAKIKNLDSLLNQ